MNSLKAIHIVYAEWCPHCVPTTLEPMKTAASKLGVPCLLHDIDVDEKNADQLVKEHGDWCEDYLVPQVFLEFKDGAFKHMLTGYPEGVAYTKRAVGNLLGSSIFQSLR